MWEISAQAGDALLLHSGLTGLGPVGPPALQFWALRFLPLPTLAVVFIRFCSGAAQGIELSENLSLFSFVLPLVTLLLIQSCSEFDSLCNQLIGGTSAREGQEYEAWSLTLVGLSSCGTAAWLTIETENSKTFILSVLQCYRKKIVTEEVKCLCKHKRVTEHFTNHLVLESVLYLSCVRRVK